MCEECTQAMLHKEREECTTYYRWSIQGHLDTTALLYQVYVLHNMYICVLISMYFHMHACALYI